MILLFRNILFLCLLLLKINVYGKASNQRVMVIHAWDLTVENGGNGHVYVQIKALLLAGYQVTLWYPVQRPKSLNMLDLPQLGVDVIDGGAPFEMELKLLQVKYIAILEFAWDVDGYLPMLQNLNQAIKDADPSIPIIFLNPDILHIRAEKERFFKNQTCTRCTELKEVELYMWNSAEVVVGVNEHINAVTRKLCPSATVMLLPYVQVDIPTPIVPWNQRKGIIYFAFDNIANNLAAEWLIKSLPFELLQKYDIQLDIYGSVKSKGCIQSSRCVSHGARPIETLHTAILKARWMVAPIFTDVGISTKILKALAIGTPVITTPFGLGGMESIGDVFPIIVANSSDLISTVFSVYNDEELWISKQKLAKMFISKHFGMQILARESKKVIRAATTIAASEASVRLNLERITLPKRLKVMWDVLIKDDSMISTIYRLFPFLEKEFDLQITNNGCPSSTSDTPDVFILFRQIPLSSRPPCCLRGICKFILYLNWDFGYLPRSWVEDIHRNVDSVWALSTYQAALFNMSGIPATKIHRQRFGIVCPNNKVENGVDIRMKVSVSRDTIVFGYIASAYPEHAIRHLVTAYRTQFAKGRNVLLIIWAPNFLHAESVLSIKGVARVEIMTDPRSFTSRQTFLRGIDVLVFPYGSEWSIAPLEALSVGTPLVISSGIMSDYITDGASTRMLGSLPFNCTEYHCREQSVCFPSSFSPSGEVCQELVANPLLLVGQKLRNRPLVNVGKRKNKQAKAVQKLNAMKNRVCSTYQWATVYKSYEHAIYAAFSEQRSSPRWMMDSNITPRSLFANYEDMHVNGGE